MNANPLRSILLRITLTSPQQLPYIVKDLALELASCSEILSQPTKEQDGVGLVQRFLIQLSTLLASGESEARWAAVVLIEATLEAVGWQLLQQAGPWRSGALLNLLGKHDTVATHIICITTQTKIFLLSEGHPSLTREITTTTLPSFITHCLNCISSITGPSQKTRVANPESLVFDVVLQAFTKLLPLHPPSFRPFLGQITTLIRPLLAPTPSGMSSNPAAIRVKIATGLSNPSVTLAQDLYAVLPHCAPKNGSSDEWNKTFRLLLHQTQQTADQVFRAVKEDWKPPITLKLGSIGNLPFQPVPSQEIADDLLLPGWMGIYAGIERLSGLLQLSHAFLCTTTPTAVSIPVDDLMSITERILSVTSPDSSDPSRSLSELRLNPEVGRDEREALWLALPHIHTTAIDLISLLMDRLGKIFLRFHGSFLERLLWVFRREKHVSNTKLSIYKAISQIAQMAGPGFSKATVLSLTPLIITLCDDTISTPREQALTAQTTGNWNAKTKTNGSSSRHGQSSDHADSYLGSKKTKDHLCVKSKVQMAAEGLLSLLLWKLPTDLLSLSIRGLIDRTAILVESEQAMTVSVLHPPPIRSNGKVVSSILPYLVRMYPDSPVVEAILRPRMPMIPNRRAEDGDSPEDSDEDMLTIDRPSFQSQADYSEARFELPKVQGHLESPSTSAETANIDGNRLDDAKLDTKIPQIHAQKRIRDDGSSVSQLMAAPRLLPHEEYEHEVKRARIEMKEEKQINGDDNDDDNDGSEEDSDDSLDIPPIIFDPSDDEDSDDE